MKALWMSLSPKTRLFTAALVVGGIVTLSSMAWAGGWLTGWWPSSPAPKAVATAPAVAPAPVDIGAMPTRAEALKVMADDRVLGQFGAPLTIIEYASLTCPHCAHFTEETFPQVKKDWIDTGKATFVLRDLPWDNLALGMSTVARCVPAEQFYPMAHALFKAQEKIVSGNPLEGIKMVAAGAGLSGEQVDACIANAEVQKGVLRSKAIARDVLAVKGTPTFFINGTEADGSMTYKDFKAALEKAYAQATAPAAK